MGVRALKEFAYMKIGLASPEMIRDWSFGEVKKPETINYRTLKPERDGLFCERIFGPSRDWECHCGKYKRIRHKGIVCERCGVEVTKSNVRRERMGHIELSAPVSHIWYFKGIPNRMGLLLDMTPKELEEVIYFVKYVVTEVTPDTDAARHIQLKQVMNENEYRTNAMNFGSTFRAAMGAEAIKALLANIDLDAEAELLREDLKTAQGQKRARVIKRLEVVEAFRQSGNNPEWMIMDVLPVIPPNIRPMVELDGGRFATSDLNDLYRRVINRNNRLKKLLELRAPGIIVQNEKRMLQEAVDALIDNGRRGRPVTGPGNRPLKSLSHMLKGKQGRFRQNLLGKRVDYSGRSVIVVGPTLKIYQCGLPKEMALELFKPFVIHELVEREMAQNIKMAKKMIEQHNPAVYPVLEEVVQGHPVLLNRAPTLHRLGIQAFEPRLVEGKAIRLHPLVTTAFNADFDGDQMAVHVPLSQEAQAEARVLMLAANNILNPKDGKPVVTPSQDMVLGNYYLTMENVGANGEGSVFSSFNEAMIAYQTGEVSLHSRIAIKADALENKTFTPKQQNQYLITTVGKLVFNEILPASFPYVNSPKETDEDQTPDYHFVDMGTNIVIDIQQRPEILPFKKGALGALIARVFKVYRTTETAKMLDAMKDLGFKYSTIAGMTVAAADVVTLDDKKNELVAEAQKKVDKIEKLFSRGLMTDDERHQQVIKVWADVKDGKGGLADSLMEELETKHQRNPIFMMQDSGARGNKSNFTQLAGMRGLMANPKGETIELPIKSSFREGLTVLEYFISTHGARKGLADTALKTADSGYLTRRLVDVSQDVIIREHDCGTDKGLAVRALAEGREKIEGLYDRIIGRYAQKTVLHPETQAVIVNRGELITDELAQQVIAADIEVVEIRSALTCNTRHGICQKCYGRSLATGNSVEIGEAVGVMAAQSIGEPGTQLTMRTFHTGGVAGGDITQGLPRIQELFEARNPKGKALLSQIDGTVVAIDAAKERPEITVKNDYETIEYQAPYNARVKVVVGEHVQAGQRLTEGAIDPKELLLLGGVEAVQSYIIMEVQKVYRLQGVEIEDKHIEVIVRQMLRKIRIVDAGDTTTLPGVLLDHQDYSVLNNDVIMSGRRPAVARPVLLGITKASIETNSFLSAASFQETTRVLTDAAVKGKTDHLLGLKENVIIGNLIPAGTGFSKYQGIEVTDGNELPEMESFETAGVTDFENTEIYQFEGSEAFHEVDEDEMY
ncbi:MAG: DNA-directed RNA polymerase subunit beta' [Culicoidibacterales bacterium]